MNELEQLIELIDEHHKLGKKDKLEIIDVIEKAYTKFEYMQREINILKYE